MFLIFCLVNMVMAIDVLMKYALRFLHSMSGCVPVDIKNCTAVACLFYFWLFVWGRQWAGGKRQANIAQAVSARSKTSFVMEFTACCSAAYKVTAVSKKGSICSISLAYPCRSNYEPDYSSKPCEGKKIIKSFWQDDLNLENVILLTLYDSHFFFFFSSEKEIWKYRLTYRDQPLLSAMPDAMFRTQGSFSAPYSQYLFRMSCLLLNKRQCPLQWPIFPSCLSYAPPSNLSDVVGCLVDFFSFSSFYFLAFLPYATRSVCSSGCSPGSHQSSFPRTATFAPLGFTTRWKPWPPELFCEIPDHLIVYPNFQMNNLSTLS